MDSSPVIGAKIQDKFHASKIKLHFSLTDAFKANSSENRRHDFRRPRPEQIPYLPPEKGENSFLFRAIGKTIKRIYRDKEKKTDGFFYRSKKGAFRASDIDACFGKAGSTIRSNLKHIALFPPALLVSMRIRGTPLEIIG